jgi:opacity protein-like surface antigen
MRYARHHQKRIMKTAIRSIAITYAVFILSVTGVRAADWSDNLYLNADVGSALQQDTQFHQSNPMRIQGATFNPGVRADVDLGYNLNDTWAVEFETGVNWNSINSVGGLELDSISESFDTYTIPLLANVIYKFPTQSSWTPYVGMGVGGVVSMADFGNATSDSSDTCFTFAWQAEAGLKYALTKNASIGVAYKYFNTLNERWFFSNVNDHVKFDGVHIHAIVASFTWTF